MFVAVFEQCTSDWAQADFDTFLHMINCEWQVAKAAPPGQVSDREAEAKTQWFQYSLENVLRRVSEERSACQRNSADKIVAAEMAPSLVSR